MRDFHQKLLLPVWLCWILLALCACQQKVAEKTVEEPAPLLLSTEDLLQIHPQETQQVMSVVGETAASETALISSEVSARVISLLAEEGDFVAQGQVLVKLDDRDLHDYLDEKTELYRKEQEREKLAKLQLTRKEAAFAEDLIAQEEVDIARTDYETAVQDRKQAQIQIDLAKKNLERGYVKSPISGIISRKLVKQGAMVSPGQELFEVVQIDPFEVNLEVPAENLNAVTTDNQVQVTIDFAGKSQTFVGKVRRINPIADPVSRTVEVIASFSNPQYQVKANMLANCQILLSEKSSQLFLPRESIVEEDTKQYVYKVTTNSSADTSPEEQSEGRIATLRKIKIQTETFPDGQIAATKGLQEGDWILRVPLMKHNEESILIRLPEGFSGQTVP